MARQWVQRRKGELYWSSTISPVDLTPVARAQLAEVPEEAWVVAQLVPAEAGFLITEILSGPFPGPDLLSRAELELSSGRPREALLELDALGDAPADEPRARLRIAALLALTPPAREEATAVLLRLIGAVGWRRLGRLAEQIGWSAPLAEAAAEATLEWPIPIFQIRPDVESPFAEPLSADRFERLEDIPLGLLSSAMAREILALGAADGVPARHVGYVERIRGELESRAAFDEPAAKAFAAIEASCARRRAAYQEWKAGQPERFLRGVEEHFGCAVPRALRSRWLAAEGGARDVVRFLASHELFPDDETRFWLEPRGEGRDVPGMLPFAEAEPDGPLLRVESIFLALDLSRPVPGDEGEVDYPVVAFMDDTDEAPTEFRFVAESSTAWLASR